MTYRELLSEGIETLQNEGIAEAALDARLLLEYTASVSRAWLLMHYDDPVDGGQKESYVNLIARRAEHIPLQQLTGSTGFMGLSFEVNEHVLIPRQDTETLVEEAMRELFDGMRILDMCTGSGCILLSLLHYSNDTKGVGVDLSEDALTVARRNARLLGLEERACFWRSDLYEGLKDSEKFDMLVSNPPYIREEEYAGLMPEVRDHEPYMALVAPEEGLSFYRRILEKAPQYLNRGAYVMFEIGCEQGEAVASMMRDAGYADVTVVKDLSGLDRVVRGRFTTLL